MKKTKITIIGGASTYTPGIFARLVQKKDELDLFEVNLYDLDKENLIKMQKYLEIYVKHFNVQIEVTVSDDLISAVKNSDFIFVQIRVGGNDMRKQYEEIAMKEGVLGQETCGPGGFAFAMAQIKPMIEIIDTARKYAPNAWVINYSNPISIISEAISRETDTSKVMWICDGPIGDAEAYLDVLDKKTEDFVWEHFGINHFWWYTSIKEKKTGKEYLDIIRDEFINAKLAKDETGWYKIREKIKKYLVLSPELLPTTYMQYYFFSNEYAKRQLQDGSTRASEVLNGREKDVKKQIEETIKINEFRKDFNMGVHGNFIVDYAIAIYNDEPKRLSVNIKNNGYIKNLPDDWIIEAPGLVDKKGARFVKETIGEIEPYYAELIRQEKLYSLLTYKAWKTQDYSVALKALTLNKIVNNIDVADKILKKYKATFSKYWPDLK